MQLDATGSTLESLGRPFTTCGRVLLMLPSVGELTHMKTETRGNFQLGFHQHLNINSLY